MKKNIRRLISLTTVIILLFLSTAVLTGCYVVKSGDMSKLEGTYKLTSYTAKEDVLAEKGIVMYIIVRADGTGNYYYKDNSTDLYSSEIRCKFTQDTEEAGKYSYVEIDFDGRGEYVKFGVFAQLFELGTTLSSHEYVFGGNIFEGTYGIEYTISATFTRVDKATDSSYVDKNLDDPVSLPFGLKKYDGTYRLEILVTNENSPEIAEIPDNPYVYYYVTLDFIKGSAKLYSMSKADEIQETRELKNMSIIYENGNYLLNFGENIIFVINTTNSSLAYSLDVDETFEFGSYTMRFHHWGDMSEEQVLELVENDANNYLNSKNITE